MYGSRDETLNPKPLNPKPLNPLNLARKNSTQNFPPLEPQLTLNLRTVTLNLLTVVGDLVFALLVLAQKAPNSKKLKLEP